MIGETYDRKDISFFIGRCTLLAIGHGPQGHTDLFFMHGLTASHELFRSQT